METSTWWKLIDYWQEFGEVQSQTEYDAMQKLIAESQGKVYHDGESLSLALFYQSIGLFRPPVPKVFTVAKPRIAHLSEPTLVIGEGVAHYVDERDLPRRFWSKDKTVKNRWMFDKRLFLHPLQR